MQYPTLRIAQNTIRYSLADLPNRLLFRLIWEASSHAESNARRPTARAQTAYSQILIHTVE